MFCDSLCEFAIKSLALRFRIIMTIHITNKTSNPTVTGKYINVWLVCLPGSADGKKLGDSIDGIELGVIDMVGLGLDVGVGISQSPLSQQQSFVLYGIISSQVPSPSQNG